MTSPHWTATGAGLSLSASEMSLLRFGVFELDLTTGELRKAGVLIHLPPQPFKILALLASRSGQLVTREEIQQQIWGSETFVDFELGLNAAIKTIRDVLGDNPETPRYIETLPRRGYRFIAPLEAHHPPVPERRGVSAGSPPDSGGGKGVVPDSGGGQGVVGMASTPHEVGAGLALPSGAQQAAPLQQRWIVTVIGGVLAVVAVLLAFNVAGLRERPLRTVGAVREPPLQIQSIAVLPLENLSGDPEEEYFADGMTEELIANLAKISALRVISRTSMMQYKGTKKSLPQIARELNVDGIIEGSVVRSGNRVRITANLLHAPADRHLWADSYESDLGDVLVLQGEVARAIAEEVRIKITPDEQVRLTPTRPVNPEAYEAYLKGRHLEFLDNAKALEFQQRAMQIDPTWAPAHAAIAVPTLFLGRPSMEPCAKARAAAGKALELDDTLSEAHSAMAFVRYQCDWDWPGAEREFKRAIELDPTNSQARCFYSHYLIAMRRFDESLIESKRAIERDPLSEALNFHLAYHYLHAHQPDLAIDVCRKGFEVWPNSGHGRTYRAGAYEMKGMYEQAIAAEPDPKWAARLKRAYGRFGARGYWQTNLDFLLEETKRVHVDPIFIAMLYAQIGQRDEAFAWLERAYGERNLFMAEYVSSGLGFEPLRADPRFKDLLRRMNLPP